MGVRETDLVAESLGDTGDHVADEGDSGVDGGDVGLGSEPADSGEAVELLVRAEVELEVGQVLREGAALAHNGDEAVLDGDLDVLGELVDTLALDLHLWFLQ
eukprot:56992_1